MTSLPQGLKNPAKPMGDTFKGLQGKKYRVVSKGEKKATPQPPLVRASRTPWAEVSKKKKRPHRGLKNLLSPLNPPKMILILTRKANNKEWKNPRCPKIPP